jgi:hypothetical protein
MSRYADDACTLSRWIFPTDEAAASGADRELAVTTRRSYSPTAFYLSLAGSILAVIGNFSNIISLLTTIGVLGVASVASLAVFLAWLLQRQTLRREGSSEQPPTGRQLRRDRRLAIAALIAAVVLGALALRPLLTVGPRGQGTIVAPQPPPPHALPVYSYLRLAKGPGQDRDIKLRNAGYVRQVFTAKSDKIATITVIMSRDPADDPNFDPDALGTIRVTLHQVDEHGADVLPGVPLKLAESDAAPNADGVTLTAGPNHKNTVVHLAAVPVVSGHTYSFTVANESGAVMAISLNTVSDHIEPMDEVGTVSGDRKDITYFHVAGTVCDRDDC